MTSFGDADTIQLHTCLSVKTYFKFTHDHPDGGSGQVDEPSSDDDNSDEETEVFRCHLQLQTQAQEPSHTVPSAASTSTPVPTQQASDSGASCLRPMGSFPLLESVPPKIWVSNWIPSPGRYKGQITTRQPNIEQVYMLAVSEDRSGGLHVSGRSLAALTEDFKECIGDAAETGDFTEILHPKRSFAMCVQSIL